jgi:hypothetical protein
LDRDELWNHAETKSFAGRTILSFSAEDYLILLCVHGVKDLWVQLKWVCDIAALIDFGPEIDWELALDRAGRLGSRRMFLLGSLLAHRLFGVRLPGEVLRLMRKRAVFASAETVISRILSGNQTTTDSYRISLYFKMDDTLLDKVRRCRRYIRP